MYELRVEEWFAAAHRLMNYQGRCENLHGHNWRVEVCVRAEELDEVGLAVDFKVLKAALREILSLLDHQHLNQLPEFTQRNPSSENIAAWIASRLKQDSRLQGVSLYYVRVWESDTASAAYYPD